MNRFIGPAILAICSVAIALGLVALGDALNPQMPSPSIVGLLLLLGGLILLALYFVWRRLDGHISETRAEEIAESIDLLASRVEELADGIGRAR